MRMQRVCRWMTPLMSARSSSSSGVRGRYGQTWAVESRSHMASMSPVMTKVSGLPSTVPKSTVVSRVFGKQFWKSHANSGSEMSSETWRMVSSTALEVNRRSPGGGRLEEKSWDRPGALWIRGVGWRTGISPASTPAGPLIPTRDAPNAAALPFFRNSLRLGSGVSPPEVSAMTTGVEDPLHFSVGGMHRVDGGFHVGPAGAIQGGDKSTDGLAELGHDHLEMGLVFGEVGREVGPPGGEEWPPPYPLRRCGSSRGRNPGHSSDRGRRGAGGKPPTPARPDG